VKIFHIPAFAAIDRDIIDQIFGRNQDLLLAEHQLRTNIAHKHTVLWR